MRYLLVQPLLVCILLIHSLVTTAEPVEVTVYSYHSDPPFYIPEQPMDLTRAWVAQFNKTHKDLKLKLVQLKRPELNAIVESGKPYMILWANALWFKRRDPKILETDNIFWDADVWVSLPESSVRYSEPGDLVGKVIGGRKGYFYKGVNALVDEGKIKRIDHRTDFENYTALKKGQVEVFVMSRSSLLYWYSTGVEPKDLYVAIAPHDAYTRHVLVSEDQKHLLKSLNRFIHTLRYDSGWQQRLNIWGVAKLLDPFELELNELESLQ